MKNNKIGFSLIEVIVATWILVVAVFWVYKLIWENTKIITNSLNYIQLNSLTPPLKECINNIWIEYFLLNNVNYYEFNFWSSLNECNTWSSININLNNIEYLINWTIVNSWSNFIEWNTYISSNESKTITWSYLQLKK